MGKPGGCEEQEDVFQAVLLADNFSSSIFGPDWAERRYPTRDPFGDDDLDDSKKGDEVDQPTVDYKLAQESLVPLANRKLIDYSLEALTVSGVQEIFIYCSNGIKSGDSVKEHIKKSKWNELPVKIQVISSEDCESLGDALRDLDGKGIIRNDFILMNAGVVTNLAIKPWLEMHKNTVKNDRGAVMTLVHRHLPLLHRSRSSMHNSAIVTDASTGKIIAYSQKVKGKRLKIPLDNIKTEMEIILDSVDTGIVACSSSVLPLFTDNFDFSNLSDFVKNILMNEEVMGNTIYLHQIKKGYAGRIVDYDSFLGISLDILERWSYPLVPDMPFGSDPGENVYGMGFDFIYKNTNVIAARNAALGPAVLIGEGTKVGNSSVIQRTSIGNRCTIGENVKIFDSQLGNDVIVEDGCCITKCVILDGTKMSNPNISNHLIVGNQRFEIQPPTVECESESDDDNDSDNQGYVSGGSVSGDDVGHQEKDFKKFCSEVLESLYRGYTDDVALENLFVEIQGSRTANFMYFDDATVAVIKGVLTLPPKLHSGFSALSVKLQWDKTKVILVKFKDLLLLYVKNEQAQANVLKTIEEFANDFVYFRPILIQLLQYLYQVDILSEEKIIEWYNNPTLYEAGKEIRKMVKKFIEWLETASEESDSEDTD